MTPKGKKVVEVSIPSSSVKFPSEALLHQAVAGLLSRMPDVSGVQILHDAQEHGKDVVFVTRGPLGEPLPCACIIKNVKISGKVGDNRGARSVFQQVEQALDTPFFDGGGQETHVHRAYVVSPEEITPTVMSSIRGKLATRSGQVVFLGGTHLFGLFRTYWPDFFSDEYAAVEGYLDSLRHNASGTPLLSLVDIYGLGNLDKTETSIYVERWFHRELPSYVFAFPETSPIPRGASLGVLCNKESMVSSIKKLQALQRVLKHLQRWGYVKPVLYSEEHEIHDVFRYVDEAFASYIASFKECWVRAAKQEVKDNNATFEQIPSRVAVRTTSGSTLKKSGDLLFRTISDSLNPLRDACRTAGSFPKGETSDIQVLSDPRWLEASRVHDCLSWLPQELFQPQPRVRLNVREDQLRKYSGSVLITGAAGYGKTSYCRWNALLDAERFRTGEDRILPVYLPLHTLAKTEVSDFDTTFIKALGRSGLVGDSMSRKGARIRFYLDGLDEVPTERQQLRLLKVARTGISANPNIQLLLTARDYLRRDWLTWLPRLELSGLNESQIAMLKQEWFQGDEQRIEEFDQQLAGSRTLNLLMRVPLLATLTILVFRQTRRLPENRARLYALFIDLLSGGWDLAKGVLRPSQYGSAVKVMLLSELASDVHHGQQRYFESKAIDVAVRRVVFRGVYETSEELEKELLADGIISRSGDKFYFSHLSFQEFLTAKHMAADPLAKNITKALRNLMRGDNWWREVFRFYVGLSDSPARLTHWLVQQIERRSAKEAVAQDLLSAVAEAFPSFDLAAFMKRSGKQHLVLSLDDFRNG